MMYQHKILLRILMVMHMMVISMFAASYKHHLSDAWYSSKGKKLQKTLEQLKIDGHKQFEMHLDCASIRAAVVPHAGYGYSGVVAQSVYQLLKPGVFKRVIILAPSHHVALEGVALPGARYAKYKSPLGLIELDVTALKQLKKSSSLFVSHHQVHELEHSIEVQIPLIQKNCGECCIVPLIVGSVSATEMETIARCLAPLLDHQTLLVISSDFTHYGASFGYIPFTQNITQNIFKLDSSLVRAIENGSLSEFKNILDTTGATVCGKYPLMILLMMLQKKYLKGDSAVGLTPYVVGYDTSSPDQKNPEHCVSYVGMVFSSLQQKALPLQDQLTGYEKRFLLKLAAVSVENAAEKSDDYVMDNYLPGVLTKSLQAKKAAFVTLHSGLHKVGIGKDLRGCIGTMLATHPLYVTVCDMARSAALHDTRFSPVTSEELTNISVSISVLTSPVLVTSYKNIRLGIDGIILKNARHQALYLPSVALEQGWNLQQTVASLSKKAGLNGDAWKEPTTTFEVFQTIDIESFKSLTHVKN